MDSITESRNTLPYYNTFAGKKSFLGESILFVDNAFKEQVATAKHKVSTGHLNKLQNILPEMGFWEKLVQIGIIPIALQKSINWSAGRYLPTTL
ncbi:hypothetical protein DRW42_02055 [Pedobacter miscanthi]|uniref:Uncharacterized protein n=1 Tax=Pedobacter miscanthi TaxID=2259170 RepID=A0A366LFL2_9SPHI|nr:hypothetical protein DRW42_02055 [Pedobacter miscanthi]